MSRIDFCDVCDEPTFTPVDVRTTHPETGEIVVGTICSLMCGRRWKAEIVGLEPIAEDRKPFAEIRN